jgi:uncharacterized membrane protein
MVQIPPFPGWSGLHPLITHFPIALFVLLPLLLIIAGLSRKNLNHAFLVAALVVMLLATSFLYLTYFTGVARIAALSDVYEATAVAHHRSLAGYTVSAFTLATLLFGLALLVRRKLHLEEMRDLTPWIPVGFIVFYGFGVFWLVLTAHQGANLAHRLLSGISAD